MRSFLSAETQTAAPPREARAAALWAALYALAHFVADRLDAPPDDVPAFWLPVGVAVACFARTDRRRWIHVAACGFLISGVAHAALGHAWAIGVLLTANDVAGGALLATLLRRLDGGGSRLDSLRAAGAYALMSASGAAAWATAAAAVGSGAAIGGTALWSGWFASLGLGALLAAPPLVELDRDRLGFGTPRRTAESLILAAAVGLLSLAAFLGGDRDAEFAPIVAHLPIPFIAWAAVRRGATVAMALLLLAAIVAACATAHGVGPVAALPGPPGTDMLWFQSFLAAAAVTTLLMSAAIAERRGAETVARERAALLEAVARTSPEAVITIDDRGTVRSFNPAASRLFGWTEAEMLGRNVKTLMPPHFREQHDGYIGRYLETGERRIIGIGRVVAGERKDGATFPMELSVGEALVDGHRLFVGFVRDLSEVERTNRRVQELQADLFHVSRLSEMGQVASGLAHEVNQPLAAIVNYAQAARQIAGGDGEGALGGVLSKIEAQATRAAEIVRRLRAFVGKHETERRAENLNVVVEEALALSLVGAAGRQARVRLALAPDTPYVWIDRVQIQQVLVNLVRNAIDAQGGWAQGRVTVASVRDGEGFVRITVSDEGPGIAPEIADRLFKAFVTTKEDGMGVGLSICRSIVEAHGGRIWHAAAPGGGAEFAFTVPVAGPEAGGG